MQTLELTGPDSQLRLGGILDPQPVGDGFLLRRLPGWTRSQIVDIPLSWIATLPSGGRIEIVTDARAVEVEVLLTRLAYEAEPARPAPFDLVLDGSLVAGATLDAGHVLRFPDRSRLDFEFEPGEVGTVRFDDLSAATKRVEVWLPHMASVELQAVRVDGATVLERPESEGRRWVHYGSSISHCLEAARPTEVWPVAVARRAGVDLTSLAIAGQCQLDAFAARTIRDLDVDLISMKVGINVVNGDTLRERTFVPAVHGFLDTVRDGHPTKPILVVTPILCPIVEDHPGPTGPATDGMVRARPRPPELAEGALTLRRIRTLLTEVVASRRSGGDDNLHLLDGLELFGEADAADLYDALHPTAEAYLRMADRFHDAVFTPGGVFSAGN